MRNKISIIFFICLVFVLVGCTNTSYEIKFVDWNDTIIKEFKLDKNAQINAPLDPTREGHTFVGWDKEFDKATSNLVIKAKYEPFIYQVVFNG